MFFLSCLVSENSLECCSCTPRNVTVTVGPVFVVFEVNVVENDAFVIADTSNDERLPKLLLGRTRKDFLFS